MAVGSYEIPGGRITYVSAETWEPRYVPVKLTAEATISVCAAGEHPVGFSWIPSTRIGESITVITAGTTFAVASAAITAGSAVEVAADGKIVTASAPDADTVIGIAATHAEQDGDIISVQLWRKGN